MVKLILLFCILSALSVFAEESLLGVHSLNITLGPNTLQLLGYSAEARLYFTNLVQSYGYKADQYQVTTEDGYILTLFRMQSTKCEMLKPIPLLLNHGVLMNAETWLLAGPTIGLPYLISDACYDLWLANARGTDHGRAHTTLDPDQDPEFWDFTIHEMGVYDQPAIIDFILSETKADKLNYFGFSAGGGTLFVTLSERPEYNDKINFAIVLAPALQLKNMISGSLRTIFTVVAILKPVLNLLGIYELFQKGGIFQIALQLVCGPLTFTLTRLVCQRITELDSYYPEYLTDSVHRSYYSKFFRGVSVKSFAHYYQTLESGYFRQYDYGTEENMERYANETPPLYIFENFKVPVLVLRGVDDEIITDLDLTDSVRNVPNVVAYKNITVGHWNHVNTIGHINWPTVFSDLNENYLSPYSTL